MKGIDLPQICFGIWFAEGDPDLLPEQRLSALIESCRQVITSHCIDAIGDTGRIVLRITPEHWFDPELGGTLPVGRYTVQSACLSDRRHNGRVHGSINVVNFTSDRSILLLHYTIDS